jgi:UTP--glucose-1-phosphate uridylyltransferase
MKVETGVIAAAGSGTRMLPVTLGYPKELLPIINKPALQLIIEEFIDSGLKRIVIITGENAAPLLRQYNVSDFPRGKYPALDAFAEKLAGAELIFEPQQGPYGNGTPLMVASQHIPKGEGFIYAFGDDLIKSETPFTRKLIATHERTAALVIGTQEVDWNDVSRYGIAYVNPERGDKIVEDLVEKPKREEAASNLAVFGRYLLSDEIIRILHEVPLGKANELWLTDALKEFLRTGGRIVTESVSDGRWLTIGDPLNYLKTVIQYSLDDADLRASLIPLLRDLAQE